MDLSLVLTQDLWNELEKRNDAVILCGVSIRDSKYEESFVWYKGGQFTCLGLAEHAADMLKVALKENKVRGNET